MLRFTVHHNGSPAQNFDLGGAYLIDRDGVPMRGEVRFASGMITCDPRTRGTAGLCVSWPVKGHGRMMLETSRLMERDTPYNLHVELARGRLMRISQKREDWGLYDFADGAALYKEIDEARNRFIEAITAPDDATASRLADEAIAASTHVGEKLAVFHADVFLKRRRQTAGQIPKRPFGCGLTPSQCNDKILSRFTEAFDFAVVPMRWRDLEPREGEFDWGVMENHLKTIRQHKLHARAERLVSFDKRDLPDWAFLWEQDYDHVSAAVEKLVKGAVKKFSGYVQTWEIAAGLHAYNALHFSFEQLMELTRRSASLIKHYAPRSASVLGITLPWGEYYAQDAQTIPPSLYAEMAAQSGVAFDAIGLEVRFYRDPSGLAVRDLMQVSSLLDKYGNLGKPMHVTAAGIPSAGEAQGTGSWRGPWSEESQAAWLREFYRIALSKPFVETVAWSNLVDHAPSMTHDGALRQDLTSKPVFESLSSFHKDIVGSRPASSSRRSSSADD